MTKKVQKILLIIFLTALIVSLMAASFLYASTYGRYSGGALSDDSTYDDTIEFIGTERYVVRTPEELNDAIENGYSYIQIADDAEQPFVITTDVQDVSTNLVLDLNGTVVVRNSRNPMLNVSQGVSVVLVYDSSNAQSGAFYNPVGSALQVSGGTMTIGSGNYESGPRTNEYADATAAGTLSPQTDDIVLFSRGGVTSPATVDRVNGTTFSPVTIAENTSYVPVTTGNYYYQSEADSGYSFLTEDTFLIYTLEEGEIAGEDSSFGKGTLLVDDRKLTVPCNVASCDFYYYYPIATHADGTETYAVVYGYWDVKELAENGRSLEGAGLQWPYASIRMTAGEGFVRGGNFVNQFDVANTYGILTEENSKDGATGSLVISETGRAGTTNFTARGEAVCIGCSQGDVTISGGNFSSELGDTIVMSGGVLTISAGNFVKNVQARAEDPGAEGNGAAISMQDGALTIAHDTIPVQFIVTGSSVNGIEAQGGTINAKNVSFTFNEGTAGNGNTGILSEGGHVKLTSCTFTMPGENNRGIASQITSGVGQGYDTSIIGSTFTINGNNNRGVYVSGGRTSISGSTLTVGGTGTNESNFGIEAAGGTVDAENATINVYGRSSAGIYTSGTNPQLNITGSFACTVTQDEANTCYSAAIMATSGSVTFETDNGTINTNGVGIVVRGGTLTQNSGSLTVNNWIENMYGGQTHGGTGIYIANGNFTQAAESKLTVNSEIDGIYWGSFIAGNTVTEQTQTTNGIYITGGSLTANGTLDVTHTGVASDISDYNSADEYIYFEVRSYAVRVEGTATTSVTINQGTIKNSIGGGLYVSSTVDLDNIDGLANLTDDLETLTFDRVVEDYGNQITTVDLGNVTISAATTVTSTSGGFSGFNSTDFGTNWNYKFNTNEGHAVEIDGGVLRVQNGEYTSQQGDGIRVQGGIAFVSGGSFVGQDQYRNNEGGQMPGAAASYAFKVYGGYAKVEGGTFGQASENASYQGNGAFVMQGDAYITKATIRAGGTTGFGVWRGANVTFTPSSENAIKVYGDSTGLTLEIGNGNGDYGAPQVTINGGRFESADHQTEGNTPYGIWYGNSNAKLTITGGYFYGYDAGLQIAKNPGKIRYDREYNVWPPGYNYTWQDNRNIRISGGTFSRIYDNVGGLRVCDILDCTFLYDDGYVNNSSEISSVTNNNGISASVNNETYSATDESSINSSLSRGEVIVEKS